MSVHYSQFNNDKKLILAKLKTADISRKGCLDCPLIDLITWLNSQGDFVTTSSCSGRVCIWCPSNSQTFRESTNIEEVMSLSRDIPDIKSINEIDFNSGMYRKVSTVKR
jgi:tRNA(Phe) wybutosine-synthesizing methylase Tyw3